MSPEKDRTKVRAQRVDTKCGSIGHMTVDEIKKRSIGGDVEMACPECGKIHLTPEDACEAAKEKISDSARYKRIKDEAEEPAE